MTPRSVAVQGFGFGALAIATMGLLGGEPEPVATIGTIAFELTEGAAAEFSVSERVPADGA